MTLEQLSAITKESQESRAQKKLENYVVNNIIFMDTCSILSPYAEKFFANIDPLLERHNKKIIIPMRCMEELNKHLHNPKASDPDLPQKASHALNLVNNLHEKNRISFLGDDDDSFADNVFHVAFTKLRMNDCLLLITEDQKLARDILRLNESESVRAHPVSCQRLSRYGYLAQYPFEQKKSDNQTPPKRTNNPKVYHSSESEATGGKLLVCQDCGSQFELTPGEVQFYRSKHFELPKRCKNCRSAKKGSTSHPDTANMEDDSIVISDFPDIDFESIFYDNDTDVNSKQRSRKRERRQSIITVWRAICLLTVSFISAKMCLDEWIMGKALFPTIINTLIVLLLGVFINFLLWLPTLGYISKKKNKFRALRFAFFTAMWRFFIATGVLALVIQVYRMLF